MLGSRQALAEHAEHPRQVRPDQRLRVEPEARKNLAAEETARVQRGPHEFALGQDELDKELKITDRQRQQFVAITQELQKKVHALVKEAQSGGKPEEIPPKINKIRAECAKQLEAVLTDEQNKQWKDILGKPFDLGD